MTRFGEVVTAMVTPFDDDLALDVDAAVALARWLVDHGSDGLVLAGEGLVSHREGRISGWSLTPEGRSEHRRLVSEELEVSGAKAVVDDAYRRFLALNPELLAACTAWQLRSEGEAAVVNDHSDPDHDRQVVERLAAVDEGVRPVLADLEGQLERYSRYGPRLRTALERVTAGDAEWFTKPIIDSYHTVWFELHEDLLCTLGLERSAEGEG